jgi:hypothetical protein
MQTMSANIAFLAVKGKASGRHFESRGAKHAPRYPQSFKKLRRSFPAMRRHCSVGAAMKLFSLGVIFAIQLSGKNKIILFFSKKLLTKLLYSCIVILHNISKAI